MFARRKILQKTIFGVSPVGNPDEREDWSAALLAIACFKEKFLLNFLFSFDVALLKCRAAEAEVISFWLCSHESSYFEGVTPYCGTNSADSKKAIV
jgi:hypothetical protein